MIDIQAYKGIAPGKIIAHSLKERGLSQKELAERTHCHAQTISAIVTGTRDIPQDLSFRLDKELGFKDGFFMLVQTYYKIRIHSLKAQSTTKKVIPSIRRIVFWDIDMDSLDWQANKEFILQRVSERGNEDENKQVKAYYETQYE
jgi:addiction module HigA family antidote